MISIGSKRPMVVGMLLLAACAVAPWIHTKLSRQQTVQAAAGAIQSRYGEFPIRFEAGQAHRYVARGAGYSLLLAGTEATLQLHHRTEASSGFAPEKTVMVRMKLAGANSEARSMPEDRLPTVSHYFIGNDPGKWRTGVANYARVKYEAVYPGIDLVWYGNQRQLEHDFLVAPGADPARIHMEFPGARRVRREPHGDLVIEAEDGELRLRRPVARQEIAGVLRDVDCEFVIDSRGGVGFALGAYDRERPLVIDPILLYSTFFGGRSSEIAYDIAVDKDGNAYIIGDTASLDLPVVNPIQPAKPGGFDTDAFVMKLDRTGTTVAYATYLGGENTDRGASIAIDAAGAVYVAGYTFSTRFPVTPGALQSEKQGNYDGFVSKINPAGSALEYSTYLGAEGNDLLGGIAVNDRGEAVVSGYSDSTALPATGFQKNIRANSIFKSADRGGEWTAIDKGALSTSQVNQLAFDPNDANVIFAATSKGVFKSTDGGVNWQLLASITPALSLAIDPQNPATMYVVTTLGLLKSTDSGLTWQGKQTGISPSFEYFSVLVDRRTPANVYVGTDRGVYKSVNAAESFVIAITGMDSFSQPPAIRVTHLVADPTNSSILYAGTNMGVYKSLDGAGRWFSANAGLASPGVNALAIDPVTPSTLYLSTISFNGNMYKSVDGANSWNVSNSGLGIQSGNTFSPLAVYSIAVAPGDASVVYAGTQFKGVFKSNDRGATWAVTDRGMTRSNVRTLAVDARNPAVVYAGASSSTDGFVAKLKTGGGLEYLTYLGGSESEFSQKIALDAQGNAIVTGRSNSVDFPTANALQAARNGFLDDATLTILNPAGTALVFSTYLGGLGTDYATDVAVDGTGKVYVTGVTNSANFPTRNALQSQYRSGLSDAFLAKIDPVGTVAAPGPALLYSTYLGGTGQDLGLGVAVDAAGSALVTGYTISQDFPSKDAVQPQPGGNLDVFVSKVDAAGSAIVYSTLLGGRGNDYGFAIAADRNGNAYVAGTTSSADFPTANPLQPLRGNLNAFIVRLGVEADLAVTATASRNPVMVDNNLTYAIGVTNLGPSPATGILLTDALPAGVRFVSATSSKGACANDAGKVTCAIGELAAKANATVTIVAAPSGAGTIRNTVRVQGNEPDGAPANNEATITTTVASLPSIAGRVTGPAGQGMPRVTLTLASGQTATAQTDANGFYQFAGLTLGGSYTVTPSLETFSFEPASRNFSTLTADQTADFAASSCTYAIGSQGRSFDAAGGTGEFAVTATPRCPWTAQGGAEWIRITEGAAGAGNGTVKFTVAATTVPRSGRILVAGHVFTVYQGVNSCAVPSFQDGLYYIGSTFASAGEGAPARSIAADFNGDGRLDLFYLNGVNRPNRLFKILAGDGKGGFAPLLELTFPGTMSNIAVGDFNGDGRLDLASSNQVGLSQTNVELRLNNGQGGLGAPASISAASLTRYAGEAPVMTVADFNRDGRADLMLSFYDSFERLQTMQVFLNNGAGGLRAPVFVRLTGEPALEIADVTGDGIPDLLTERAGSTRTETELRLYAADGKGGFSAPLSSTIAGNPASAAFGDFNGDGKLDAVFAVPKPGNDSPVESLAVLFGDGEGRFGAQQNMPLPADARNSWSRMLAADLNNDGKTDLLLDGFQRTIFFVGDGFGKFDAGRFLRVNISHIDLAVADVNGDGRQDLIGYGPASAGGFARIYLNRCGGAPAIFGQVSEGESLIGISGARVRLSGPAQFSAETTTDSGGNYQFLTGLVSGGAYRVAVERVNFSFVPDSRQIASLTSIETANFTATRSGTIVSAASFRGEAIAPESIAALFGEGMTLDTLSAPGLPLPTQIGNAQGVLVDSLGASRPVRLFFVSPSQVNLLMPPGIAPGPAQLTIAQLNSTSFPITTRVSMKIEAVAPGLFSADATGKGLASALALRIKADGTQVYEPVVRYDAAQKKYFAVPIDPGPESEQVFLVLFATGLRNRTSLAGVTATIGGAPAEVSFAGGIEGFSGVDQVNLRVPRSIAGRGEVEVVLSADGKTANPVRISVK